MIVMEEPCNDDERTVNGWCRSVKGPSFILLFGSYAKGTANKTSDLDIADFSNKVISHDERFLLTGEVAQLVNIEVDLVDLKEVDTVFAAQI
ncbi:nucleotidyltransferase domain-containing protein [Lysinibacillus sp. FSL H8-0500]|uniref:type VII toxin-antitoxin system MntA family adenylyltransferase antitoxin n=1 Tax=Lysinibacillus sp. FSL H8-0500 TaxID=2921393 RepID=UPI003100C993